MTNTYTNKNFVKKNRKIAFHIIIAIYIHLHIYNVKSFVISTSRRAHQKDKQNEKKNFFFYFY